MKWVKRATGSLLGLLATGWAVLFVGSLDVPTPDGERLSSVAFTNVHIVDVENGVVRRDQIVVVESGTIVSIGDGDHVAIPAGTPYIDGDGRYLMPGLWDMHVHLGSRFSHYNDAAAFIANGVFYVRDLSSDCIDCVLFHSIEGMRDLQARFRDGTWLGPDIVELSSGIVHGPRVYGTPPEPAFLAPATAEQGAAMVRFYAERGADFIKTYNSLPRDAYLGAIEEAKRLGIYVGGHIPWSLSIDEAIEAGHRSVEHARFPLLDCARDNLQWHETYERFLEGGDVQPNLGETYIRVLATFDATLCDAILTQWAASESYYVPTHLTRLAEAIAHERAYDSDPRARHTMAPIVDGSWSAQSTAYARLFEQRPDIGEAFQRFFEQGVEITARAHALGVKIMAGTDTSDLLIYAGFSLHDELALYAGAGISPADTLRTATLVPAEFVDRRDTHGSIGVGQVGNLVFLNGNPVLDIENTADIHAIYYQGHFYDRATLDEILEAVAWRSRGLGLYLTIGWPALKVLVPAYIETGEIPL